MLDSNSSEQYAALTTGAGAVALEGWTTVRIAGVDRAAFLHNMCTADVRALAAGQGGEAFFTDVKGKIIGHAVILAGAEEHWLVGVPDQAARLIAHLDRYIIREDVQLSDHSVELTWTLIAGRQSAAAVERLSAGGAPAPTAPWAHREVEVAGIAVGFVRCPWPWSGGYLAACPAASAGDFRGILQAASVIPVANPAWTALRIESGWPMMEVDFDGANLPQEVGRDAVAINFHKGCYLGQETIARIDALGHVNKRLATVRLAGEAAPAVGAELESEGQAVGHVTSACWSPRLAAPLALAMVRRVHNDPGAQLTCAGKAAEVLPTPAVAG